MNWKNWPSWKKGAIIGGFAGFWLWALDFILIFLTPYFVTNQSLYSKMLLLTPYCGIPAITNFFGDEFYALVGQCFFVSGHITNIIIFSIIGAIIGKIKSRGKKK